MLFICLPVYLSIYLSVYLSIYLPTYLSIYLSVYFVLCYVILYYITLLTLPIVYSACPPQMGRTLCNCIFLGIIALRHPTRSSASSFLMFRSLRSFVITPSGKNPRYSLIIYSSQPKILIHSPELARISKPVPSDFFSDTNYTELLCYI